MLKLVENKNIQIPLGAKDLFPSKNSSVFTGWSSISWEDYKSHKFAQDLIQTGCINEKANFYKAIVERGRGESFILS